MRSLEPTLAMLHTCRDDSVAAVEVRDLTKSFPLPATTWGAALRTSLVPLRPRPRTIALRPTDLCLTRGSTVALVGENGAGKTTLLRLIAGLLLPDGGAIHLDGAPTPTDARSLRRSVAWVPCDDRSFVARLSARENLRYFADLSPDARVPRERITTVLAELDLADHADRPYRSLSSGQRQRLAIARGWLRVPRILLLDEPTRSLDPAGSARLFRWLDERRTEDPTRTVILSTHRLEEAERHTDRIITIEAGGVVADRDVAPAVTDGVRYHLRTEPTLSPPEFTKLATAVVGNASEIRPEEGGFSLTLAGSRAVDALVDQLRAAGISIASLAPHSTPRPAHGEREGALP